MNIAHWSGEHIDAFGDYEAAVAGARHWRSADLHARACRLASALVDAGLVPNDRVLLLLPNGAELIVAFTATLMAGGVAVPLFAGTTGHEIERVIAQIEPFAVVAGDGALSAARVPARDPLLRVAAPGRCHVPGWESLDAMVDAAAPLAAPAPRDDTHAALICFTGGTSSAPKGVVFTHGGIRARHPRANRRGQGPPEGTTVLAALPLGTMGGMLLTGRLIARTRLILHDGFEPRRFVDAIERYRVRALALVPPMAEAILALPDLGQRDLTSLRNVTLGGSPVAPDLLERLAAILPIPPSVSYGLTEAGGGITTTVFKGRREGATAAASTGPALASVDVRIRDEDGHDVVPGHTGEVHVRTPWLSAGYYGQPELTAERFQDGWLRTGDLGYVDSRGQLHIVGRRTDVIIQAGVNVQPADVVAAIRRLPGVADCAVIGVPNRVLGEEVVACVVPAAGAAISGDTVIGSCREQLDPRKLPTRALIMPALPATPAGKLDSAELRRQVLTTAPAGGTPVFAELQASAADHRSSRIGELIATLIGTLQGAAAPVTAGSRREGLDRTFEELGLDSLQLVRLSHRLGEVLGQPVSPLLAFSAGTPAALAARVATDLFCTAPTLPRASERRSPRSPIAIVGVGCRLPPAIDSPDALWQLLDAAMDASGEIRRWTLPRPGGAGSVASATTRAALLEDAAGFDAPFFGMSHREAAGIDPQHRLALEVTWHALEHAGWNPLSMRGTATGLFLGMSGAGAPSLEGLGAAPSMAAARICHFLDLHGPAAVVDTACSSSLFAIHAAVRSLRDGECDVALAGGVSIIGSPRSFIGLSRLGTLAPDGRCKAFDVGADGYGRGEGCVLFVLKPLPRAEADGDRVLAVISGTAAVHDGRSASLAAPNGRAQEAAIRRALDDAGVEPASVDYLEAHGTGTPIGDPIEVGAAVAVLGDPSRRLVVGSVKTNIGHLEAAAGAAGLLKVVLALQHERIPAHLHLRQLNPLLEPMASHILIPTTSRPWPARSAARRIAGVTSLGLSGTNVHVVVEDAASPPGATGRESGASPRLLCITALSDASLDAQIHRFAAHLESAADTPFADLCFTSAVGRATFDHRAAVVAASPQCASAALHASLRGSSSAVARGTARARTVAFLFSGHGTQHAGMGKTLYDQQPVFRAALDCCADILQPLVTPSLIGGLGLEGPAQTGVAPLDDPTFTQPALVSFAWALSELWRSWGVTPAWVAGHSLGECAAACVAGLLPVEDALTLAATRGRLLASLTGVGGMVAVRAADSVVARLLHGQREGVAIAAVNGPQSTVLSGHRQPLAEIVAMLTGQGIDARWLAVPCAAHSPVTDPVLDELEQVAAALRFARPHRRIVSTSTGRIASYEELSNPRYWGRQMREPVRFADAVATLAESGCDAFVEIGPDPVLLTGAQDTVRDRPGERVWVAAPRRDRDAHEQMLASLGELFVAGIEPAWPAVYGDAPRRRVAIPGYAFERRLPDDAVTAMGERPAVERRPSARGVGDRPPASASFGQRLRAAAPEERRALLQEWIRHEFALCTGVPVADVAPDRSCLELGVDSLRIADLVSGVQRAIGIACNPSDIVSHPTPDALSQRLAAALPAPPSAAVQTPANVSGTPTRTPPRAERPLVVLHRHGVRPALFCFHPSGGRITPYLRLRGLLGDDQPLYAIQSRALTNPEREHATLAAMAVDYATILEGSCEPPYSLLGWSLGGLIAHAVAGELERRGALVAHVGMIDARAPRTRGARPFTADRAFALMAWLLETQPQLSVDSVRASVGEHDMASLTPAEILRWCERHGVVSGVATAESLDAALGLYHRHFGLADGYEPRPITAPIDQWWVGGAPARGDTAAAFGADVREHVVGGTHFSVMQSPTIDSIAAVLAGGDRLLAPAATRIRA